MSAPGTPQLRLEMTAKAEARSRTGGAWSLGHLRLCWLSLPPTALVLVVIAVIIAGGRAVAGVLLGAAIVGVFFTLSSVIVAKVGARNPKRVMPAALGTYIGKVVALGVVLTVLPRDGIFDTRWMALGVGVCLFVWLAAHMRYVWTTKIFYVDPS
ncbi:hypothetical protein GIS00_06770 [Nakamurella sp. YIM 132087]|uniref:Uncharacterized protein n=1 Tax=Nakamurella alba TaxID=2665158 RepID=A0A7K1FHP2_9ACTN|nr:hypothetical protein [Nakamurella alba]MTD13645.1 hypothetical protein [Nakamurella alba]